MCTTQDLHIHFLSVSTLAIHNHTFKHSESQVTILMRQAYNRKTKRQALFNSTLRLLIKSFNYCANSVYLQSWCRQCADTVLCTSGKTQWTTPAIAKRFLAYFCGQQKTCSLASEMVEFVTEIVTGLEFDYWWHSTRNKNRYVQNTIEYFYSSDTFTAIVWQPVNWQRLQRPRTVGWGQTRLFTIRLDVARPWLQRKVHIDKNKRSK